MGDPRNHDHQPDRAALEELMRAFGSDRTDGPHGAADDGRTGDDGRTDDGRTDDGRTDDGRTDDGLTGDGGRTDDGTDDGRTGDDGRTDDGGTDDEIVDVGEPDPPGDAPAPPPRPVIRIDEFGATEIEPGIEPAGPIDGHAGSRRGREPGAGAGRSSPGDTEAPVVIAIADEDLPDPVYVEGSLDRDGSASIVIIEDDTTGDTLGVESEREVRRGIEPRLRERRVAVKRAQGRKRLKWVVLGGAVVAVVVGALAVLGSPLFAVRADRVTLTGNVYADPAAVQAVLDDIVGTPALRVDTQAAERELEAIPWVEDARVRVDFPYAATIEIREREAWTTYLGPDQRHRVLDDEGRVLDVLDGYPIAYVLLTGPDPVDLEPGEFAPRGYAAASELAKNLTGSVRPRTDRIEVTADGSRLSLWLDDGSEVRFGEARDLFAKLVRLETVLTSGEALEPGIIDVSTREVTLPPPRSEPDDG